MKSSIQFLGFVLFLFTIACGNNMNKTLDGKSYQISNWDINQPEKLSPDVLVFKDGMLDSEDCHQYGFTAAAYTSSSSNDVMSFTSTIVSPTEGSMLIEGKVKDNQIDGTMVWKKEGQADINYGFKGSLKP